VPPRFLSVGFPAFGELRVDTTVEAALSPEGAEVAFLQGGRVIASGVTGSSDVPSAVSAAEDVRGMHDADDVPRA
jgi:hypothetical protein